MPIKNTFCKNGVVIEMTGVVTDEELQNMQDEIYSYPYEEKLEFQIGNFLGIERFDASMEQLRKIGEEDRAFAVGEHRQYIALVVQRDSEIAVELNVYSAWAKDVGAVPPRIEQTAMETMEEAYDWLRSRNVWLSHII